ncbi:MAG: DUF2125 domain-containing protein [Methylovirgula sp.]
MTVEVMTLRRRPRFGPWLIGLAGLGLFVILVWTIFWHVAAQQSASSLDAWIAQEKAFNRNWNCPNRQITGFPFTIEIGCSKPHFDGNIFGRHYSGSLNGFVATAKFTNPSDVAVKVVSPFAVVSDDKTVDIALAWDQLDILLGGLPQDVAKISIAGQGLSLQGHAQEIGVLAGRASRATATFTRDAGRQDQAIHFHIALNGASSPAVDAFLGSASPAEIAAEGDITQASFDPAQTLTQTLDQWRAAGGHVDLADLTVTRGETKFQARGTVALDSAHQLQAQLDMECLGFEPVLRRLGVDPALITAGSLLASLFGGGSHGAAAGPQPLHLLVGFDGGLLSIGPVRTSIRLPPLY